MSKGSLPSLIEPPSRVFGVDRATTIAMAALVVVFPLLPGAGTLAVGTLFAGLTAVSWVRKSGPSADLGMFWTLYAGTVLAGSSFSQLSLGLAIALYLVIIRAVPWLRGSTGWLRRGCLGWDIRLLCLGTALVAGAALVTWFIVLRPNVDDLLEKFFPNVPPWLLITAGAVFSMVNAALEEAAYRGILMYSLEAACGPGIAALLLQALAFGTAHIRGFPRGWPGVGLATIYGLLMGVLRIRSQGLLAPWMAHAATDVTIVSILALLAHE